MPYQVLCIFTKHYLSNNASCQIHQPSLASLICRLQEDWIFRRVSWEEREGGTGTRDASDQLESLHKINMNPGNGVYLFISSLTRFN